MASPQARAAFQKAFNRLSEQARKSGFNAGSGGNGGGGGGGGRGGGGPSMGSILGGGAGLFLLVGGGIAINSSLFNGEQQTIYTDNKRRFEKSKANDQSLCLVQLMVVIGRSSTLASEVLSTKSLMKERTSW